ncbi:hypothetical protein [Bradyrhizobium monzae]|uniref:hypothetical protein n=1 Tax=Bradyrhizobium sp. Oc8 TaxID=2876780 RepID=UPI001F44DEA6|nr:hypothetical protein [Bradyrhizobium sp. Oc8]
MSSLEQAKLRQIAIVSRALARRDGIDYRQTSRHERHQYRREAIITLLGNWTLDDASQTASSSSAGTAEAAAVAMTRL